MITNMEHKGTPTRLTNSETPTKLHTTTCQEKYRPELLHQSTHKISCLPLNKEEKYSGDLTLIIITNFSITNNPI